MQHFGILLEGGNTNSSTKRGHNSTREAGKVDLTGKNMFEFGSQDQAVCLQAELAKLVIEETPSFFKPRLFCGLDVAYKGNQAFGSAVIWDLKVSKVAHRAGSRGLAKVDYAPGSGRDPS